MIDKKILGRPKKYKGSAKGNSFYISEGSEKIIKRFAEELNLSNSGVLEVLVQFGNANFPNVIAYKKGL